MNKAAQLLSSALVASSLVASPALAHDFWLQPRAWHVRVGVPVPFTVEVGHGSARERWAAGAERVVVLRELTPKRRVDLRPAFKAGGQVPHLTRTFREQGLHIVGLQSTNAFSELPAIRFNDYLAEEGLTPAVEARARTGASGRSGREFYSRRAKTLVQVGSPSAADIAFATRAIGLTLEIVPGRSPYALDADRRLPVMVLYQGRALAGALVKLTSLEFDAKPLETARTDSAGRAVFRIPPAGSWLLNVVWTRPITSPVADYETIFSSMTFGYGGRPLS